MKGISEIKTGCNCDNFQAFAKNDCIYLCYLDISLLCIMYFPSLVFIGNAHIAAASIQLEKLDASSTY